MHASTPAAVPDVQGLGDDEAVSSSASSLMEVEEGFQPGAGQWDREGEGQGGGSVAGRGVDLGPWNDAAAGARDYGSVRCRLGPWRAGIPSL